MAFKKRIVVQEAEQILGEKFEVLDNGFVRLVDYMGSDESIVQAARISYGKGTKKVSDDRKLIRYLMRYRHTTPFEMVELKFHVRVPMDAWRQWIRHRTASVNEYSTRYSEAINSAQRTSPGSWRRQSELDKQRSRGFLDEEIGKHLSEEEGRIQEELRKIYQGRLESGVAREQARKDLPLSTYTEAYWKMDLHNLFHFLRLRLAPDAQYEIREYAQVIAKITKKVVPVSYQAFEDYILNSMTLSAMEQELLVLVSKNPSRLEEICHQNSTMTEREIRDFEKKVKKLKIM